MKKLFLSVLCTLLLATPASAGELFGGLYSHDVDTPLTKSGIEGGADIQLGYRWDRIGRTPLQPYAFAAANTAGETHYAAAGLSAKFGDRVFVRPGVGIAIHTGSDDKFNRTDRIALGSRVLFEPELGVGFRLSERASLEASVLALLVAWLLQLGEAAALRARLQLLGREGDWVVSSWALTSLSVELLRQQVRGSWGSGRVAACLARLQRFLRRRKRADRQDQEGEVRDWLARLPRFAGSTIPDEEPDWEEELDWLEELC